MSANVCESKKYEIVQVMTRNFKNCPDLRGIFYAPKTAEIVVLTGEKKTN